MMGEHHKRPISEWTNWQMCRQLVCLPLLLGLCMWGAAQPPF